MMINLNGWLGERWFARRRRMLGYDETGPELHMSRINLLICILTAGLSGWSLAGDVIVMPLPSAQMPSLNTVANRMIRSISTGSPKTSMFNDGLDALSRYASRDGQVRNHYNSSGFVARSTFMRAYPSPYYDSYRGPRGWGWYGSPIVVNNYCPNFERGCSAIPMARRSFVGFGSF